VGLFDRVRRKDAKSQPEPATEVDLAVLIAALTRLVPFHEKGKADLSLVRARIADRLRDVAIEPPDPVLLEKQVVALDDEAGKRLALLVDALDGDEMGRVLVAVAQGSAAWVERALVGVARDTAPLTLEVLRLSAIRAEELARRFVAALPARIQGETSAESVTRLGRLDYARLLEEAEAAKKAAQAQGYLKDLQKKEDAKRVRRGKF
jgi:hypothetical protein